MVFHGQCGLIKSITFSICWTREKFILGLFPVGVIDLSMCCLPSSNVSLRLRKRKREIGLQWKTKLTSTAAWSFRKRQLSSEHYAPNHQNSRAFSASLWGLFAGPYLMRWLVPAMSRALNVNIKRCLKSLSHCGVILPELLNKRCSVKSVAGGRWVGRNIMR